MASILSHTSLGSKPSYADAKAKRQKRRSTKTIVAQNRLSNMKKQLRRYLVDTDLPDWYRGVSAFQLQAAFQLSDSIRDDSEQRTTHRTRYVLGMMGMVPLVRRQTINKLMRLSKGNDLAFLWFLMEMCYRTPGKKYSYNEQTIMSLIFHLDLIPTIRQLDLILPPSHKTRARQEMFAKQAHQQKEATEARLPCHVRKQRFVLPYFAPLPTLGHYGHTLVGEYPARPSSIEAIIETKHRRYCNSAYLSNRWYGAYELKPKKRIVHCIIHDEVEKICSHFEGATLETDKIQSLCEHHKAAKELEESLAEQLKMIAKEKCEKLINVAADQREETKRRILTQLDEDVACFCKRFKDMVKKNCFHITRQALFVRNQCLNQTETAHKPDFVCIGCQFLGSQCTHHSTGCHHPDGAGPEIKCNRLTGGEDDDSKCCSKCGGGVRLKMKKSTSVNDFGNKLQTEEKQASDADFFNAAKSDAPHRFDYYKIFDSKRVHDDQMQLKREFIKAVDSDIKLLNKLVYGHAPVLDEAIRNRALKIFEENVKIFNEEYQRVELKNDRKPRKANKFEDIHYDGANEELMKKLLHDALKMIAQDHRYVLPSLPEAWKTPILREWIYARYGKKYSQQERISLYKKSIPLFNAINHVFRETPPPAIPTTTLIKMTLTNYAQRDVIIKNAQYIRDRFHRKTSDSFMEIARVCFFAMRPLMCHPPPTNTFFAYMPARISDITHFRIWQSTEYRDNYHVWKANFFRKKIENQI